MKVTMKLRERKVVNYSTNYSDDEDLTYIEKAELATSSPESVVSDDVEDSESQRGWTYDEIFEDSSDQGDADNRQRKCQSSFRRSSGSSSKSEDKIKATTSSFPHAKFNVNDDSTFSRVVDQDDDDDDDGDDDEEEEEEEEQEDDNFETPSSSLSGRKRKQTSSAARASRQRPRRCVRINYKEESDSDVGMDAEKKMDGSLDQLKGKALVNKTPDMALDPLVTKSFYENISGNEKVSLPGRRRLIKLAERSDTKVPKEDPFVIENLEDSVGLEEKSSGDANTGVHLRFYTRNRKSVKQLGGNSESASETKAEILKDGPESTSVTVFLERNHGSKLSIENDFLPGDVEFFINTYKRSRKRTKKSHGASKIPMKREPTTKSRRTSKVELNAPRLQVGVFGPFKGENDERPIVKQIGQVDKILSVRNRKNGPAVYCVKECGKSYRNAVDVNESLLLRNCPQLVRNFLRRIDDLRRVDGNLGEPEDGPAFNPLYIEIDRIIAAEQRGPRKYYLVKWCGLPYSETTWEWEDRLAEDKEAFRRFLKINSKPSKGLPAINKLKFRDGRVLRDYQEKGLAWLYHNFQHNINCILADEMGLGKTMQSVAMLQSLRIKSKTRGPFLVIAPVSTLGHWQREVESLTDMNCVVYSGSMEDREVIREYDFYYTSSKALDPKFNILLTSFEILMKDQNFLSKHEWQYIIVDEAHRLKTRYSKTTRTLKQMNVRKGGLLLLTGTPIQNNTKEIFSLLNVLDPEKFNSEEEFLFKYGDIKNAEQVKDLQETILRPRLLRRMKEDVEKTIPLKEETIIWVELTREQRAYYRAIYENRISDLLKGSQSNNIPNLRNVAMELRKLCNHPFLCDGLEEDLTSKYDINGLQIGNVQPKMKLEFARKVLCQASGKMLLLDKLLPMLREAGRRVLIFSQFTIMLDLIEDYLNAKGYSFERIDGKIRGSDRQAAIDRYSAEGSDTFVFLLSTRAGGLGITLTAANTCIIYDSDWNPQNDLQAMARCHRIGQTKDVKVYRLITRNTYEQHLFECSSRKYGLDEAILGNMLNNSWDHEQNQNIESLLKRGAYDMLKDDGEAEAAAFHAQNIDQILEQRTQKRLIGGRGNNTFSVATFVSNQDVEAELTQDKSPELNKDSMTFWQELLPEACHTALNVVEKQEVVPSGGRRKRGRVNYRENCENSDESSSEGEERRPEGRKRSGHKRRNDTDDEDGMMQWSEKEIKQLENRLIMLGRDRTEQVMVESGLQHYGLAEVQAVADTLIQLIQYLGVKEGALEIKSNPVEQIDKFLEVTMNQAALQSDGCNSGMLIESSEIEAQTDGKDTSKQELNIEIVDVQVENNAVNLDNRNIEMVGDVQAQKNPINIEKKIAITMSTNLKLPEIPSFAQRVMSSQGFLARLQRNISRYLQILHEREVLAKALSSGESLPQSLPRTKKLPSWWGEAEDLDLLKGAHKHGHREFSKIRDDESLCFAARFNTPKTWTDGVIILPMDCQQDQAITQNMSSDTQGQTDDWPHDSVLMARLKRLIECLPNGLTEREMRKRAAANEYARRRNQELRAMKISQEVKNAPLPNFGVIQGEPLVMNESLQQQQLEVSSSCYKSFIQGQSVTDSLLSGSPFPVPGSNFPIEQHDTFKQIARSDHIYLGSSNKVAAEEKSSLDGKCGNLESSVLGSSSNQLPNSQTPEPKQQTCPASSDICTTPSLFLQEGVMQQQKVSATLPVGCGLPSAQIMYTHTNSNSSPGYYEVTVKEDASKQHMSIALGANKRLVDCGLDSSRQQTIVGLLASEKLSTAQPNGAP